MHLTAGEGAAPYQHGRPQGTCALPPAPGLFPTTHQGKTSWCPRDLCAGTAHPTSAHHLLDRPVSAPMGSRVPPSPGRRHSLGSVPTLISLLFPLEDTPAVLAFLGLEGLGTARDKSPWGPSSLWGHTPQCNPSPHMVGAQQHSGRQPVGTPDPAQAGFSAELSSGDSPTHNGTPRVFS